jgi:hypothetical protein
VPRLAILPRVRTFPDQKLSLKPRQIFLTRPSMVLSGSHELTAMTIRRGKQMFIKAFTAAAALTGVTASIASAQTVEHNGPGGLKQRVERMINLPPPPPTPPPAVSTTTATSPPATPPRRTDQRELIKESHVRRE